MSSEESEIDDRAQRFRDAALPHLDEVYTAARYLLRNTNDAQDAVQECYLRALRHFDGYRGPAMKPWLLAILKNLCRIHAAPWRRGADRLCARRVGGRGDAGVAGAANFAGKGDGAAGQRQDMAAGG